MTEPPQTPPRFNQSMFFIQKKFSKALPPPLSIKRSVLTFPIFFYTWKFSGGHPLWTKIIAVDVDILLLYIIELCVCLSVCLKPFLNQHKIDPVKSHPYLWTLKKTVKKYLCMCICYKNSNFIQIHHYTEGYRSKETKITFNT